MRLKGEQGSGCGSQPVPAAAGLWGTIYSLNCSSSIWEGTDGEMLGCPAAPAEPLGRMS